MNINDYENKLEYPKKIEKPNMFDFIHRGISTKQYMTVLGEYEKLKADYDKKIKEYREEDLRLVLLFEKDSIDYVGLTDHPNSKKIFNYAWEQSHSEGYQSVLDTLHELVLLII